MLRVGLDVEVGDAVGEGWERVCRAAGARAEGGLREVSCGGVSGGREGRWEGGGPMTRHSVSARKEEW